MWAMEGTSVELTLSKQDGMHWWNCVVKGDPIIDTHKVIGYSVLYATSVRKHNMVAGISSACGCPTHVFAARDRWNQRTRSLQIWTQKRARPWRR